MVSGYAIKIRVRGKVSGSSLREDGWVIKSCVGSDGGWDVPSLMVGWVPSNVLSDGRVSL